MELLHNPRCSKSRQTLALLEDKGFNPEIKLYLDDVPSKNELLSIVEKLGIPAEKLIRKGEKIYKENFKGKTLSNEEWIEAMVEYPKLIERPILINGEKAAIGRPPEDVLNIV
jgi:arsenate reductase